MEAVKAGAIAVRLTSEEGLMAAMQASVQQMRAIQKGWVGSDHGGASGRDLKERWANTIHGQMCEHALAKALDVYAVAGVDGVSGADPGGLAVRGTVYPGGHLIINRHEIPKWNDTIVVLVCGHWPAFEISGWIYGREAVRDEWWRSDERPPSWWVPYEKLRPAQELHEIFQHRVLTPEAMFA